MPAWARRVTTSDAVSAGPRTERVGFERSTGRPIDCPRLNKFTDLKNRDQVGSANNPEHGQAYSNLGLAYQKWAEALENFQSALGQKDHDAYKKGIARMKEKLGQN